MENLKRVTTQRMPQVKQKRLDELVYKSKMDKLTKEERQELDASLEWVDRKDLEKAYAIFRLKRLGVDVKKTAGGVPLMSPVYIPTKLRRQIEARTSSVCECHQSQRTISRNLQIDHVILISLGGKTMLSNAALACSA